MRKKYRETEEERRRASEREKMGGDRGGERERRWEERGKEREIKHPFPLCRSLLHQTGIALVRAF